jgi:hypothetical protein
MPLRRKAYSEEDRNCVSASPLKQQHGVETSRPAPPILQPPALPAERSHEFDLS